MPRRAIQVGDPIAGYVRNIEQLTSNRCTFYLVPLNMIGEIRKLEAELGALNSKKERLVQKTELAEKEKEELEQSTKDIPDTLKRINRRITEANVFGRVDPKLYLGNHVTIENERYGFRGRLFRQRIIRPTPAMVEDIIVEGRYRNFRHFFE